MGVLTRIKKQETRASTRQKDILKVVHPHRYVEIFREPITAGEIMRRYPRHCIARPDFFEFPWIVVRPESILVPGKVFYLVPYHTIHNLLKSKRQQNQSAKIYNHYQKYDIQNSPINNQQQDKYHRRQSPYQHHNDTVNYQESYCNDTQGRDFNDANEYKQSFYESWNKIRETLIQSHQESYDQLDSEHGTPLDSLKRSGRPDVVSPEHVEFQRLKSCMRKEDSVRKKLNLKVSFQSPVRIPDSRRGSPSVQKDDLVLNV